MDILEDWVVVLHLFLCHLPDSLRSRVNLLAEFGVESVQRNHYDFRDNEQGLEHFVRVVFVFVFGHFDMF